MHKISTVGLCLCAFLNATPSASAGRTSQISLKSSATQDNSSGAMPSVSADGRFVAFTSAASQLVAGDTNGKVDVFVRDRLTGQILRVSVSSSGEQADDNSHALAISADGRYVAFDSYARNLVTGENSLYSKIFLHDLQTGKTERVDLNSDGLAADRSSSWPAISADGRYVAFASYAGNLFPGEDPAASADHDVFVRDRKTGTTRLVSISLSGRPGRYQGNDSGVTSTYPSISADGRMIAFASFADDLVTGDKNQTMDCFVRDMRAGVTQMVSVTSKNEPADGSGRSSWPIISANGRFVGFESDAQNLAPGDNDPWYDVFVRDRALGTTRRISNTPAGKPGNESSTNAAFSADGRYVAFQSRASDLIGDDHNATQDIFVYDRQAKNVQRVSINNKGAEGNDYSEWTAMSASGGNVFFHSTADNLSANDANGATDVFARDMTWIAGADNLGIEFPPQAACQRGKPCALVFHVHNQGTQAAVANLTQVWPDGVSLRSSAPAQGRCSPSVGVKVQTCDLGSLPAGGSAEVAFSIVINGSGEQNVTTSVGGQRRESTPRDNRLVTVLLGG